MEEDGQDQARARPNGPAKPSNNQQQQQQQSLQSQIKQAKRYEREFQRLSRINDVQGLRKYAATKIQANFRRHKEGREALALRRRFTRHAQRIQRYWKKYMGSDRDDGKDW